MTKPFIFVSTYKLKEDQAEKYKEFARGLCEYVQSKEPRLIAFNIYFNDDGTEVTGVQVHPDAASMQFHMQVVREYMMTAWGEFLESPILVLVCGEGNAAREMIRAGLPAGTSVTVMPQHINGFTRSSAME